ncbi:hypothetical protein [Thalassolituus sp.]|uniref:hypothetical protein n=1 Tax=Thalassolituus sp. TaxID=2030822 RepID=UPI0035141AEA
MNILKQSLVILAGIVLAACKPEIVSPMDEGVHADTSFDVAIEFTGTAFVTSDLGPEDLLIELNSVDVTSSFVVNKEGATASAYELADYIFPGKNILKVTGYRDTDQIEFYYDTEGPEIHILDTDHLSHTVTGYVFDRGGVESLMLDGVSVDLDENNAFTASFYDEAFHTFEAEDSFGHTSSSQYARCDQEFAGISARLNQGGFDFLVNVLETELNGSDLSPIVAGMDPVRLLNTLGLFDMSIKFNSVSFSNVDVDLNVLDNERIDTDIQVANTVLGFTLSGRIGFFIPYNSSGTIRFSQLASGTDLLMDIRDSDLDLSLSNTTINHSFPVIDFANTSGLLNILDALTSAIVGALAPMFERLFIDVLEEIIVPVMSDFIKDIPITLDVTAPQSGETVSVRALPTFLDSADRGVSVDLSTHIWAPVPSEDVPGAIGSLFEAGETPSLGAQTPAGEDFHFGASVSANVVNQALLAAFEAGMNSVEMTRELNRNATPAGIAVYRAPEDEIDELDEIRVRLEPASAPFVKFMPATGVAGKLGWYDVYLAFDLYKPEWDEFRTVFGVTFNLAVPFDINSTEDGFLSIGVEQAPEIYVSEVDESGIIRLMPGFINSTIDYFMPWIMPEVAKSLKVVPLPRIYNHTLYMRDFWVAGTNSLSLAGDLIPVSVTASASVPATTVQEVSKRSVDVAISTYDDTGEMVEGVVSVANGEVTIDVDGLNPNSDLGNLEYRYRVDGGSWSIWKQRDTIRIRRLLAGDHEVEICSRTPLLKREVSCPVVNFTTTVN